MQTKGEMVKKKFAVAFLVVFLVLFLLQTTEAFPPKWIFGMVLDALDGTSANDYNITFSRANNPSIMMTDLIGPNCASLSCADNEVFFDCQQAPLSCNPNDVISIKVFNNGSGYVTWAINVTISGGTNDFGDIQLKSPPNSSAIIVDDTTYTPANEIDLLAGSNLTVFCNASAKDSDGYLDIKNATGYLYYNASSSALAADDKNVHYTNASCSLLTGADDTRGVECGFSLPYFTNSSTWTCNITIRDNQSINGSKYINYTTINQLLAVGLPSTINFGTLYPGDTSLVNKTNVTNLGNIPLSINVYGFANNLTTSPNAFNCTAGTNANISLYFLKYNVTDGPACSTLSWSSNYWNLTNLTNQKGWGQFKVGKQTAEGTLMRNYTCWILKVPSIDADKIDVGGICKGVVSFTACGSTGVPCLLN